MQYVPRRMAIGIVLTIFALAIAAYAAHADRGAAAVDRKAAVCDTYRVAVLDDDSHRSAMYAIQKGVVKSSIIGSIKVDYLQIPGLIQATSTGQYQVVETSLPGVVNARVRGGLDLRVAYIALAHTGGGIKTYVRASSSIRTVKDLVGKTVGVPSLGSTAVVEARIVYKSKYGVNAAPRGGDIRFVELDPPTLLNAVRSGQVDAALLWHYAGWLAQNDKNLRILNPVDRDYKEVTGSWPVGSAFVVRGSEVNEHRECVREFQRMMTASLKFTRKHIKFVSNKISRDTKIPAAFIRYWWSGAYRFGGYDAGWVKEAQALLDVAARNGEIPAPLNISSILVK